MSLKYIIQRLQEIKATGSILTLSNFVEELERLYAEIMEDPGPAPETGPAPDPVLAPAPPPPDPALPTTRKR